MNRRSLSVVPAFVSLALFAVLLTASACNSRRTSSDPGVLRVGASPVPHAAILEHVKPILARQGITLQLVEMTDYVRPNLALVEGELDANFFQHEPYLAQFNADRGQKLVAVARVHVEPLGIYSRKVRALADLRPRAVVALPNDPTNTARALTLLQTAGLLRLKTTATHATVLDIADNPRQLDLRELEGAQLPRALSDVDAAVINTNYALEAGLQPDSDALVREGSESPYANILVVQPEKADDPRVQALVKALQSPETRRFIEERFKGAILPVF
ncbi:MetQ/NlpA family ABC transporter substrate-binding protein [Chondromyces crocatus]|uniref:Lipoprotein n=1 Tax=Chondromyces crocatus TaxID=52 RepID=A0A0K1E9Q2_CHOCO|nr:MetQ/NlpA family ABC transporter substrate-binding protein [Chondromyces crocatus]AKT37601.1 methionine ABC transporter substrate-binding protein [Chondromyces crocatus]